MKKLIFTIVLVLFPLIVVDRLVSVFRTPGQFGQWYAESLTYLLDKEVDWKLEPKLYSWGQINRDFFRGPSVSKSKPVDQCRIAVIGGSAAFDLWKADSQTWSEKLKSKLNARYNGKIEILNAGTPGYSTWQAYRLLKSRLMDWKPDLVVLYELYNDSMGFSHDDKNEIIKGWSLNAQADYIGIFAHPYWIFDLLNPLFPNFMDWIRMTGTNIQLSRRLQENNLFWRDDFLKGQIADGGLSFYRENRENMADFLALRNIPLVIASQASLIRQENTPIESSKIHYVYRRLSPDKLWAAYQKARSIDESVSVIKKNVGLIRADQLIPATLDYFIDEVHLSEKGSELLADRLFDYFVKNEMPNSNGTCPNWTIHHAKTP